MSGEELVATFEGHCSAAKACPKGSCACGKAVLEEEGK